MEGAEDCNMAKHLNKEVMKYKGPILRKRYNRFFNSNMCHVCKSRNSGNLISCEDCCLVSYCTENHKKIHYKEHALICKTVSQLVKEKPQDYTSTSESWYQWRQSRKNLIESTQEIIGRPLKPYEKQIIWWPRMCCFCLRQDELVTCKRCLFINYCQEHKDISDHSKDECHKGTILLNIEIKRMSIRKWDMLYKLYNFLDFFEPPRCLTNMFEFFMDNVLINRMHWTAEDYILSDYISEPLTVYNGLQITNLLYYLEESEHTIHVLSSNFHLGAVRAWELLLHFLPKIRTLTVVFIGPEIESSFGEIDCCTSCEEKKRRIVYICQPMLYHDFLQAPVEHKVPSIITGFQAKFYKKETWVESIKAMQTIKCPLLLGASNRLIPKKNIEKIQEVLKSPIEPVIQYHNFLHGYVPFRNLDTRDIYYNNAHIIIFYNLSDSDRESDSDSDDYMDNFME